jgi:hypothetical protein
MSFCRGFFGQTKLDLPQSAGPLLAQWSTYHVGRGAAEGPHEDGFLILLPRAGKPVREYSPARAARRPARTLANMPAIGVGAITAPQFRRPMLAPVWRRVDALEPHFEQMERPERGCSDGPFLRLKTLRGDAGPRARRYLLSASFS